MRIFSNLPEAVKEVERDLYEMGIRVRSATVQDIDVRDDIGYEMIELRGYGYVITGTDYWKDYSKSLCEALGHFGYNTPNDKKWLDDDFLERISPEHVNPGNAWLYRKDIWVKFLHDGKFAYTYNERFRTQLNRVIVELIKNPTTRQAVMTVYDTHLDIPNWGGKARVPCSLSYQFFRREGRLDVIYMQRSCDFLTHFIFDNILAVMLMTYIADEVSKYGEKVYPGHFTHFLGSLHAFKKDLEVRGVF